MSADPPRTAIALLVAYHAERERAYATFMALVDAPAAAGGLAAARAALSTAAAAWLDEKFGAGSVEPAPLPPSVDLACVLASVPIRAFALSAAGVATRPDKLSDLAALSTLAGRTARALGSGDMAQAAHLNDLQCAFLRDHATDCLDELATQLVRCGGALYRRLGELMQQRLADDRAVLARS
jgi:hypothetical protein